MKTSHALLLFAASAAIVSCNKSNNTATVIIPSDTNALVKQFYRDARFRLPDEKEKVYASLFDVTAFLQKHRDEMLKTLEVVDSASIGHLTAVFARYSVGTNIYREVVWVSNIDGENRISSSQYYSEYTKTNGIDWKSDQGKALLAKSNEWTKDSKSWPA